MQQALAQATNNRLYQAKLQRIEVLKGRLEQAGKRPNPELESKIDAVPAGGDHVISVLLTQKWERGNKRDLRRQIADAELQQGVLEAEDYLRSLNAQIRIAYIDMLRIQKESSLHTTHAERINRMVRLDEVRVREGEIASLNLRHLLAEAARVSIEVAALESRRKVTLYQLNGLLGAAPETDYALRDEEPAATPLPTMEQAVAFALKNRPDLKGLRTALQQAEYQVSMEEAVTRRDWSVGLGYLHERAAIDAADIVPRGLIRSITDSNHLLQVMVAIPLPLLDNNSGNLSAALAEKKAREVELAHAENKVRTEIAVTLQTYRQNQGLRDLYGKTLIPNLEDDLRREEAAYELAATSLGDWLRDQLYLAESMVQSVEIDFGLRRAVIELEMLMGGSVQQALQSP